MSPKAQPMKKFKLDDDEQAILEAFEETLTANKTTQLINHYVALCEAVPLYPIQNDHDYDAAVNALNCLLDLGGADENHPLARLVTALGIFIENYEQHLPLC